MVRLLGWICVITYIFLFTTGCAELLDAYAQQGSTQLTGEIETDFSKLIVVMTGMLGTLLGGLAVKRLKDNKIKRGV